MRCWVFLCRTQGLAIYKVKGPLSGSEQRNGFPEKWDWCCVFESKGSHLGSFSWTSFHVLSLASDLECVSGYFLCPVVFRIQHLPFKEHLSILSLRQTRRLKRTAFPYFGFVFLFLRETKCPSKLYLGSFLSGFLLLPREEFGIQIGAI